MNCQNPKNPSGFFLHVCLCYPGHVLLGLKVTVVLLQLTTARAAGHGGRTLPGPSLGQQEGLAVLVTCPPHSTAFCTKGKSLSPKTKVKMTGWHTRCHQRGISAVPVNLQTEKQLSSGKFPMRWCHKGCLGLAPLRMS